MPSISLNDIIIRKIKPEDLSFIFDAFRESFKNDSKLGKSCRTSIFNREFNKVIDYILSTATVAIACAKEDINTILGFIIYQGQEIIHYVFIKSGFRQLRLASVLMAYAFGPDYEARIYQASLMTEYAKKLLKKKPNLKIDANPFILYRQANLV